MKLRPALILLIAFFVLLLQTFLLNGPEVFNTSPDILLFLVFLSSFYCYPSYYSRYPYNITTGGVMLGNYLIGIMKDVVSQGGFGTMGFLYLLCGLIVAFARQITFRDDLITQSIILFGVTYLCYFLYGIGLSIAYGNIGFWYVAGNSIRIALATTLLGGLLLLILHKIYWWHQTRTTAP